MEAITNETRGEVMKREETPVSQGRVGLGPCVTEDWRVREWKVWQASILEGRCCRVRGLVGEGGVRDLPIMAQLGRALDLVKEGEGQLGEDGRLTIAARGPGTARSAAGVAQVDFCTEELCHGLQLGGHWRCALLRPGLVMRDGGAGEDERCWPDVGL